MTEREQERGTETRLFKKNYLGSTLPSPLVTQGPSFVQRPCPSITRCDDKALVEGGR